MNDTPKLPTYEVEFIPAERRLTDRRKPEQGPPAGKRKSRGRRASDQVPAAAPEDGPQPRSEKT